MATAKQTKSITELFTDLVPDMLATAGQVFYWSDKVLNGVLQNDYVEVEQFGQYVGSNIILLTVSTADISGMQRGAGVRIDDIDYTVGEIRPNSGGTTTLQLRETS